MVYTYLMSIEATFRRLVDSTVSIALAVAIDEANRGTMQAYRWTEPGDAEDLYRAEAVNDTYNNLLDAYRPGFSLEIFKRVDAKIEDLRAFCPLAFDVEACWDGETDAYYSEVTDIPEVQVFVNKIVDEIMEEVIR